MKSANIPKIGRVARRPWYRFWKWVESRLYTGKEYTLQVPFGRRVFTPWFKDKTGDEFAALLKSIHRDGALMASPDRTYLLHQLVRRASRQAGDMAECGVYQGGSAQVIASTLEKHASPARLDLFDTFEGVPSIAIAERDYHAPGSFSNTSLDRVKERLSEHLPRCRSGARSPPPRPAHRRPLIRPPRMPRHP